MTDCVYHPIYRSCVNCGAEMSRGQIRECLVSSYPSLEQEKAQRALEAAVDAIRKESRSRVLHEVRALIQSNAQATWKSGLIDRSDALTDLLVEFDRQFPEGRESW